MLVFIVIPTGAKSTKSAAPITNIFLKWFLCVMGAVGLKRVNYCCTVTVQVDVASPTESVRVTVYVPGVENVSLKNAPVLIAPLESDQ